MNEYKVIGMKSRVERLIQLINLFSKFQRILSNYFEFFYRGARFIIPVIINVALRILMFSYIQLSINRRPDLFSCKSWLDVFTIWDGGWYNLIAKYWYQDIPADPTIPAEQVFAFYPGFPALIMALNFFVGDVLASQVTVATIFGIAWIPIFQLLAEHYLSREESLSVTLIFSLFPTVFLFTSVGYSEGLFLTLTLLSWLLNLRSRHLFASIAASGASLTRSLGVLTTVPFLIEGFIQRDILRALLYALPILSQAAWFYYGFLRTGNFFVVFEAQNYWKNRIFWSQFVQPTFLQTNPPFSFNLPYTEAFMGLVIALLSIFIPLVVKVYEFDWKLGFYSTLTLITIICFGNILSCSRFMSFIFPIWLIFKVKRNWQTILVTAALAFFNLITGYLFARWVFLG